MNKPVIVVSSSPLPPLPSSLRYTGKCVSENTSNHYRIYWEAQGAGRIRENKKGTERKELGDQTSGSKETPKIRREQERKKGAVKINKNKKGAGSQYPCPLRETR